MSAPVVFLDLDGVANCDAFRRAALRDHTVRAWSMELARAMLDPARVARVQRLCDGAGAEIVIASGWRRWATLAEITEALRGAGLTAPVVDVLGGVKMHCDLRAMAAEEWLEAHPEVTRYVILDDSADLWWGFEGWKERLVHIADGIEDAHVARALAILEGRAS